MVNQATVLDFLSKNKEELRKKYGVLKIGLFGSYARNDQIEVSDIDIAVELISSMKNIHNFLDLRRELENNFAKKVDLITESALKPIAKEWISKEIIYV